MKVCPGGCKKQILPSWKWCNECGRRKARERQKKQYKQRQAELAKKAKEEAKKPKPLTLQEIKQHLTEAFKSGDQARIDKWKLLYDAQLDFEERVKAKDRDMQMQRLKILRRRSYIESLKKK